MKPIPVRDKVPTYEEVQESDLIGVEVRGVYDGVCYWYNEKTNEAFPREGLEDLFDECFPKEDT